MDKERISLLRSNVDRAKTMCNEVLARAESLENRDAALEREITNLYHQLDGTLTDDISIFGEVNE